MGDNDYSCNFLKTPVNLFSYNLSRSVQLELSSCVAAHLRACNTPALPIGAVITSEVNYGYASLTYLPKNIIKNFIHFSKKIATY